LKIASCWLLMI